MKQIVISLDLPEIIALEKHGDKEAIAKVDGVNHHLLESLENFNFSQ